MKSYLKYKGKIYKAVDASWDSPLWRKADELRNRAQSIALDAVGYYRMASDQFKKEGDMAKSKVAKDLCEHYRNVVKLMDKR